jgi:hypothetical protein
LLARREQKSIASDRVVIIPGPPEQVEVVHWIFETFAQGKTREREIAGILNQRAVPNVVGKRWTYGCVRRVLVNERYIGNNVWNRTSGKLRSKRIKNAPDQWVRADGAGEAIISRALFDSVQAVIRRGFPRRSSEDKLKPLRRLLRKHGYLNARLINESAGVPSTGAYHRWFGGLFQAYKLVGYNSDQLPSKLRRSMRGTTRSLSNARLLEALKQLLINRGSLSHGIINESDDVPCSDTYQKRFGSLARAYELIGYTGRAPRRRRQPGLLGTACRRSNGELLAGLRRLLEKHGYLTALVIEDCADIPCASTYRYRFGSLRHAYELIGYGVGQNTPKSSREDRQKISSDDLLEALARLMQKRGRLNQKIINDSDGIPGASAYVRRFGSLTRAYKLIGYTAKALPKKRK